VTLDEYQQKASTTDAPEIARNPDLSVLLPGLAGEVGSLLTLYKKRLRDGDAFQMAQSHLSGDSGLPGLFCASEMRQTGTKEQ
jgi:hypothetical protein